MQEMADAMANSLQIRKMGNARGGEERTTEKNGHIDFICHACGIKAHIKAVYRASEEKRKAHANKGMRDKPQQANAAAQQESEGEDEKSAQALCTTPTLDTAAAVSPYLLYVHIIFDANQPGSRPMQIYSVLDTGVHLSQ